MIPSMDSPAPTCQVLTMGSAEGNGVALHIAGAEIPLSLSDALRISRLLFEAVEEMVGGESQLRELNTPIEAKEDHKPFTLEFPTPSASLGGLTWTTAKPSIPSTQVAPNPQKEINHERP